MGVSINMFSGLIHFQGRLINKSNTQLTVETPLKRKPILGESISIDGVCLSVKSWKKVRRGVQILFDISRETWKRTTLSDLKTGHIFNVEVALKAQDSLGGHIVQGHVDGVGGVAQVNLKSAEMKDIWFSFPKSLSFYIVEKGSISINGVSLTVAQIKRNQFSVSLIPLTLKHTNMGNLKVGDRVNLETDVMAKYVEKYLKK
ncbi:MAG: riboflavin synthase [Elusimicrobiota bacterium]